MPHVDMNEKDKSWVFTVNNWTADTVEEIRKYAEKARYCVYGKEIGEKCGTPHLQGYITFKSERKRKSLCKCIKGIWCQPAKGTAQENTKYTTKDGKATFYGKCPMQGARNDLHSFVLASKNAKERFSEDTMLEEYTGICARYDNFANRVQDHYHPPKRLLRFDNRWLWGTKNTGKSYEARRGYEDDEIYLKNMDKWWCGYNGQLLTLIEEFVPEDGKMHGWLKKWTDIYVFRGEPKGGSKKLRPRRITVTSNYSIRQIADLCGWDETTYETVAKRFKEEHLTHTYHEIGESGVWE